MRCNVMLLHFASRRSQTWHLVFFDDFVKFCAFCLLRLDCFQHDFSTIELSFYMLSNSLKEFLIWGAETIWLIILFWCSMSLDYYGLAWTPSRRTGSPSWLFFNPHCTSFVLHSRTVFSTTYSVLEDHYKTRAQSKQRYFVAPMTLRKLCFAPFHQISYNESSFVIRKLLANSSCFCAGWVQTDCSLARAS